MHDEVGPPTPFEEAEELIETLEKLDGDEKVAAAVSHIGMEIIGQLALIREQLEMKGML